MEKYNTNVLGTSIYPSIDLKLYTLRYNDHKDLEKEILLRLINDNDVFAIAILDIERSGIDR